MTEDNKIYAKFNSARISAKKVVPVLNLIRDKSATEAEKILKFDTTKAAKISLKVLKSAFANAKHSFNIDKSDLYVSEARVDSGPAYKRGRISGKSRFSPILKRTSHIVIGLSKKEVESSNESSK